MKIRIGLGKDSHRFLRDDELELHPNKCLVIGGVLIPNFIPFKAHSDGDVLYHAVFNAIASALGMSSIGHYFPDTDQAEAGRNSADYLVFLSQELRKRKARVENLGIVVECKQPKIDPLSAQMKSHLAELLHIEQEQVSITATTGEGMTPWGQGLGVEVTCSALIYWENV